ncbi:polyprenyl synthetase family protein [Aureivirga sp. CE67]|uniref:polyprenyl synthetase family protein n=1 Tax=Aureivirga sp. CE67 TaxID=1788983 RepID=UPI0018CACEF4|nr:polyprenyl synthetase family protein [Aureivirga sp. CE67]
MNIERYKSIFLTHLEGKSIEKEPVNLYAPINYILNLGGKRLRPILALLSTDAFGDDPKKALDVALAIEVFHNFTLIHDDIMDDAPLRRGKETVHEKWDINTGILSGDAMLILAYQILESYEPKIYKELMRVFNQTALEVCEGQQMDMDFETRTDVTLSEYMKMITLKTSVLVAAALQMGGIIAGASEDDKQRIYDFGLNLGLAFQLQDDYLDAFGNPETFGKQVGGDIIENKKTYLVLKALENATSEQSENLLNLYTEENQDQETKIEAVKNLFEETGAVKMIQDEIENYTQKAFEYLEQMQIDTEKKQILIDFGNFLMKRNV